MDAKINSPAVKARTRATEWGVLNWKRLRIELGNLRREAGIEEGQLSKLIPCAASTVYRIEDTAKLPNYEPRLSTIEGWLRETNGPSLSAFIRAHEVTGRPYLALPSLQTDATIEATSAAAVPLGAPHVSGPLSPPDAATLLQLQDVMAEFAHAIAAAAAALRNNLPAYSEEHRPDADTGPDEADGGEISAKPHR